MTKAPLTRLVAIAAGAALLSACTSGSSPQVADVSASALPSVSASTTLPRTDGSFTPQKGAPDLRKPQTMMTGLEVPWGLAFLPDGGALVSERDKGDIIYIPARGGKPSRVYKIDDSQGGGEGGLLGLAIDPEYPKNGFVYAYYTAATENKIARFKLSDAKPTVIFAGITRGSRHNGGRIAFGPDGMLYVGTGDASDGAQSQDPDDVNGKILRLTRNGKPAPGNPTPGSPVWSMGHRNVQGLAWGPDKKMYAIEFGQDTWDEVNVIEPGRNYGWPAAEGKAGNPRYADPIVQWHTDEASPSGAAISGNTLYVAALKGERLWLVPLKGGETTSEFTGVYGRLRTVAIAPDGALWLTTSNRDGRGDPKDGDDRILRFPLG